jgi:[ribosomal protein S5]-alanine N-acetyltransferase
MFIETKRLIIREFEEQDVEALYKLKYDLQVLEYNPTFIKRNANIDDAKEAIQYFQNMKDKGDFSREIYFAIVKKDPSTVIGAVTVSLLEYLYEIQMGWMMNSEYCGQGYASEAGAAASDYLLDTFSMDYLAVVMDVDNPASFRTAQKSGFRLFEKRVPYDYHYSKCNVENFKEVDEHFTRNQVKTGSCYYYFRKFNKNSIITSRFYGDIEYDGRFS